MLLTLPNVQKNSFDSPGGQYSYFTLPDMESKITFLENKCCDFLFASLDAVAFPT